MQLDDNLSFGTSGVPMNKTTVAQIMADKLPIGADNKRSVAYRQLWFIVTTAQDIAANVTVKLLTAPTENGVYVPIYLSPGAANTKAGDVIAKTILPTSAQAWLKVEITGAAGSDKMYAGLTWDVDMNLAHTVQG